MAEPPSPPPPPPLPPPMGRGRGKVGKVWVPKSKFMEGSIPNPIRIPAPVTRYRPYFANASTVGVGPYGYDYCYGYGRGYQCVRPPLPQLQPQVGVNGFVQNRGNVDMVQGQTALFGLVRRGTGVFHPLRVPVVNNNRASSSNNRGRRNKQRAEASYQIRRSKNTSKGNNDGSVKQEECHEHTPPPPEIDLPQEWTY